MNPPTAALSRLCGYSFGSDMGKCVVEYERDEVKWTSCYCNNATMHCKEDNCNKDQIDGIPPRRGAGAGKGEGLTQVEMERVKK